jgi:predicted nucleic acid-binding protein
LKMHKIVIVNTSPLFYLHKVDHLHILEKLYSEIIVPYAVLTEIEEGRRIGEDVPEIKNHSWIQVRKVTIPASIKLIPDLGQGEAEVLALACEENNPLLIIDDALARKIANLQEIKFTGTAGILLRAKKEGLIKEMKSVIDRLKKTGFYLSDQLILEILKSSGEG